MSSDQRSKLRSVIFGGMKDSSASVSRLNLNDLAQHLGVDASDWAAEDAIAVAMRMTEADLNTSANRYREKLLATVKPTVVNRRIAAFKSAWTRVSEAGMTRLRLKVRNPHVEATRAEFPPEDVRCFLHQVEAEAKDNGGRDRAIILLIYERLVRQLEIEALNWPEDVDLRKAAIRIDGSWLTINPVCHAALKHWLESRGRNWSGPLFTSKRTRDRLCQGSINRIVSAIGERAGMAYKVNSHLLCQAALDRIFGLGWDLLKIQEFSRFSAMTLKRHVARMPKRQPKAGADVVGTSETLDRDTVAAEVAALSEKQHKVLTTLHESGPGGLTGPELVIRSGFGGATGIFKGIQGKSFWNRFVFSPETLRRGRFRFIWTFDWPYI